jgi:CheY-like chemotaxis protein
MMKEACLRVLCIDDEPDVLALLNDVLLSCDYKVLTACSIDAGMRTIANQRVDAVILDYEMPGKGGEEAVRAIRASVPAAHVVIFSGFAKETSQRFCSGADEWVEKPDFRRLLRCLDRWRTAWRKLQ